MGPTSLLPALISLSVAVATLLLIVRITGAPEKAGRYASIDGLRGYLAFAVFLHHSCVWYFYLRTGEWEAPPSRLYLNFAHAGVAMFFMITGFLFYSKLIDGKTRGVDWHRLYVSRVLRLAPMNLFVVSLVVAVVAALSGGTINVSGFEIFKQILPWLTMLGSPDVNGVHGTSIIIAGVNWSLRYEWLFYFALPLLALTVRLVPPMLYLLLALLSVTAFWVLHLSLLHVVSFSGGISAAILVRFPWMKKISLTPAASALLIALLLVVVLAFSRLGVLQLVLLSIAFILIACGNDLFGVLTSTVSRTLGEMAYSLYLLHGFALFVVFRFLIGLSTGKGFSPEAHWAVVVFLTPILILTCYATYRLIERPAMHQVDGVALWLRNFVAKRRPAPSNLGSGD